MRAAWRDTCKSTQISQRRLACLGNEPDNSNHDCLRSGKVADRRAGDPCLPLLRMAVGWWVAAEGMDCLPQCKGRICRAWQQAAMLCNTVGSAAPAEVAQL